MLDIRALIDATGSTASNSQLTTVAGQDGQVNAGVPLQDGAKLAFLSFDQLVAGTPWVDLSMLSNDIPDPQNGLAFGAIEAPDLAMFEPMLPYRNGAIIPRYDQTAAARLNAGLHWMYSGHPGVMSPPATLAPANYSTTFSGALTASTWGEQALNPQGFVPGKYGILGYAVDAITSRGLIRFSHADWGIIKPGGVAIDGNAAITLNRADLPSWVQARGRQFIELSKYLGTPEIPTFTATSRGTGLNIQMLSNTADTPVVVLYLHKVA